jgi:uncharacterized repeat protein (TIGR01451 family)
MKKSFVILFAGAVLLHGGSRKIEAQTLVGSYSNDYSIVDLGTVPGVPPSYGGLTFKIDDPNTIIIGGTANSSAGLLYSIGVVRNLQGHVTGFNGTATVFAAGAYNDGGVVYGPSNVLFLARWNVNQIGQTTFGSTNTDKIVNLSSLGIPTGPGGLAFVPPGFPGAGRFKMAAYSDAQWYDLTIAPDGAGTFDITAATNVTKIVGGPEGILYPPPGSPQFTPFGQVLVCEYGLGSVSSYAIDANGDPLTNSRSLFISGLTGAEGAATDPLTGDFLFSTFGGGSRVVVVRGFASPTVDLAVLKTATPNPVTAGSLLTYGLTVTNRSLLAASGIVLTDVLPPNITVNQVTTSFGDCVVSNNTVVCDIDPMPGKSHATVQIQLTPNAPRILTNTAFVTSREIDSDLANNTNTIFTSVVSNGASNQPPVVVCTNLTRSANANCQATATIDDFDGGSVDPDGTIVFRSISPAGPYPKGQTPVTLTVADNHGATNTCVATITVVDTTPPTITCPANIITNVPAGETGAVVFFNMPQRSDNCDDPAATTSPITGTFFPLGVTIVTGIVYDDSDNTNTCTFTVTVVAETEQEHDLAIVRLQAPKVVNLKGAEPSLTRRVKVRIQNRAAHDETISSLEQLAQLVQVTVNSLGECTAPAAVLRAGPPNGPFVLKPGRFKNVFFEVTYNCANDPLKSTKNDPGHEDYTYNAVIHHSALGSGADSVPANDVCPRPPNPATGDPGCGAKNPDKTLGAPVTTDVVQKG